MPRKLSKRKTNRARVVSERERLLYGRDEVAAMLGVSMSTVIRMENDGRLATVRLCPGKSSRVMYRAADVHRLADTGIA
jgi:DNA-binding XRE family transcriptional regulator